MADLKHTPAPGPWSAGGTYAFKSVLRDAQGRSIASGGNNRQIQGKELEDSLILAAAAPELLAACQAMFNAMSPEIQGSPGSPLELARAAIAKATGSAQ